MYCSRFLPAQERRQFRRAFSVWAYSVDGNDDITPMYAGQGGGAVLNATDCNLGRSAQKKYFKGAVVELRVGWVMKREDTRDNSSIFECLHVPNLVLGRVNRH